MKARAAVICLAIVALFGVSVGSAAAQVSEPVPMINTQEQAIMDRMAALPAGATQAEIFAAMGVVNGQVPGWTKDAANPEGWTTLFKCIGGIGVFIGSNFLLLGKIKNVGGILAAARRLIGAGNSTERWRAVVDIFGNIAGIGLIVDNCGG